MVICLERGADLHMTQRMPLPLTVSCFTKIQIGVTFLVPAHPGSPRQRAVKRVCVCVCVGCYSAEPPAVEVFQYSSQGNKEKQGAHKQMEKWVLSLLVYKASDMQGQGYRPKASPKAENAKVNFS